MEKRGFAPCSLSLWLYPLLMILAEQKLSGALELTIAWGSILPGPTTNNSSKCPLLGGGDNPETDLAL